MPGQESLFCMERDDSCFLFRQPSFFLFASLVLFAKKLVTLPFLKLYFFLGLRYESIERTNFAGREVF